MPRRSKEAAHLDRLRPARNMKIPEAMVKSGNVAAIVLLKQDQKDISWTTRIKLAKAIAAHRG